MQVYNVSVYAIFNVVCGAYKGPSCHTVMITTVIIIPELVVASNRKQHTRRTAHSTLNTRMYVAMCILLNFTYYYTSKVAGGCIKCTILMVVVALIVVLQYVYLLLLRSSDL